MVSSSFGKITCYLNLGMLEAFRVQEKGLSFNFNTLFGSNNVEIA